MHVASLMREIFENRREEIMSDSHAWEMRSFWNPKWKTVAIENGEERDIHLPQDDLDEHDPD